MLREGIIICEKSTKRNILKNRKGFSNYKFYTLSDIVKLIGVDVEKEGIYYLSKEYGITPMCAEEYIGHIRYISMFNDNPKFDILKGMYQKLKENGFTKENGNVLSSLRENPVTILYYHPCSDLKFLEEYLKSIGSDYKIVNGWDYKEKIRRDVYKFDTVRNESRFIFSKINELLKDGTPIEKIKIMGYSDEYDFDFRRLSKYYNIPINFKAGTNIISTDIALYVLDNLSRFDSMSDLVEDIRTKFQNSRYLKTIVNIINEYHLYNYSPKDCHDILKYEFKKASFDKITYENAIELEEIENYWPKEDEKVFIIGFNLLRFPKVYKNNSYLDDDTRFEIGLDTSDLINDITKKVTISSLNAPFEYCISYKLQGPFESYLPSPLISELGYNEIEGKIDFYQNEEEDLIAFGSDMDEYGKFGVEKHDFRSYVYDFGYKNFDGKFKGIDKETLEKFQDDKLSVSYSSMKKFYSCPFAYYCQKVLNVEVEEDKLAANLGTFAHYLLEHSYDEGFSIESYFDDAIKDAFKAHEPTGKERFFSKLMCLLVQKVIDFNRIHESISDLHEIYKEQFLSVKLLDGKLALIGFIDKMMVEKDDDQNAYVAVVDYKTGQDTFKLENVKDGFNLQLPVYLYLTKKNPKFSNPTMVGLYLQKLNINDEEFRLQGYTSCDTKIIEKIDKNYKSSDYIMGMKTLKSGEFNRYAKLFNDEDEFTMQRIVEELLLNMYSDVENANFKIEPVKINDVDKSCGYCKFKDICFKKYEDYKEIEKCDLYGDRIERRKD